MTLIPTPPDAAVIRFGPDEASVVWIQELVGFLPLLESGVERPLDLVETLRDLPPKEIWFSVEQLPTAGADEILFRLQPCEALLKLMSALRACDAKHKSFAQSLSHSESSIGPSASPMVGGDGRGVIGRPLPSTDDCGPSNAGGVS